MKAVLVKPPPKISKPLSETTQMQVSEFSLLLSTRNLQTRKNDSGHLYLQNQERTISYSEYWYFSPSEKIPEFTNTQKLVTTCKKSVH